jgi:hypothetical protein
MINEKIKREEILTKKEESGNIKSKWKVKKVKCTKKCLQRGKTIFSEGDRERKIRLSQNKGRGVKFQRDNLYPSHEQC